jgi:hypothetical protein
LLQEPVTPTFITIEQIAFSFKKKAARVEPPQANEVKDMTKFFIKWWVDSAKLSDTPQLKEHWVKMLEAVKAELSAGKLTEWGQFSNGREGYAITEASAEDLCATMLKYAPVIVYNVVPVLDVDQSMEVVKKAAAATQA